MPGVSFIEFFAIGNGLSRGLEAIESLLQAELAPRTPSPLGPQPLPKLGLQPHAPNTVALAGYRRAIELAKAHNLPLTTHLAESIEEHEFIASARGPQRHFLESIGLWNDTQLTEIGQGRTPVAHLAPILRDAPILPVHLNDLSAADLSLLITLARPIVYCPRASAYFNAEAHFGPHRYKQLLAAGVPVALGTDSIINLPTETSTGPHARISILDEMRFLWNRDRTTPSDLLAMATIHGARALGLPPDRFHLKVGAAPLGIVAIDIASAPHTTSPVQAILDVDSPPELLETRKNPVKPE
jgi:cytosine/adenosine deaminase-related metal-dependent hydrolase